MRNNAALLHSEKSNFKGQQKPIQTRLYKIVFLCYRCECGTCVAMPNERECDCCHSIREVSNKRLEKHVGCITESSGFISNCLDKDVLKISYYEFKEANGPPEENQPIHELSSSRNNTRLFSVAERLDT